MTAGQIVSIIFLLVMAVLIVRGVRGHPRQRHGGVELDATGRQIGTGAMRMAERLETETLGGSDSGGGGD